MNTNAVPLSDVTIDLSLRADVVLVAIGFAVFIIAYMAGRVDGRCSERKRTGHDE